VYTVLKENKSRSLDISWIDQFLDGSLLYYKRQVGSVVEKTGRIKGEKGRTTYLPCMFRYVNLS
jgi:hypothetical protein